MEISAISTNEFRITGEIKTISDYQAIKKTIQESVEKDIKELLVIIEDAQTVTSSVVGYLLKLVNLNGIKINLTVKNAKLHKMLEDLVLIDVFNVQHA